MAFPDKALDSKNKQNKTLNNQKITPSEFKKILTNLYKNNYCLVNIFDIKISNKIPYFYIENFTQNKTPLLLSFDNVTYKSNYQNHGEIDKIIIDRNGKLATYTTKKSIQDRIQYDNEFLVILEEFISSHKDFSFNSARGIIFFSGENGILGYNTNHKNASSKYEIERTSEVIKVLKRKGWVFGSNNYKYTSDLNKNEIEFKKELILWQNEVLPIIGITPLYSFPYGELDTRKLEELHNNNFSILFYNNFNNENIINKHQVILSRKPINGLTLKENHNELKHLFDTEDIYDKCRPHF
ncbi:MAG: hypothetical protein E7354_02475 [Clostridiales bacterium]|nr:hypothetical protein [Clostridiales bacterium]